MLDRLVSFKSHFISEIWTLVGSNYAFCWQSNTSTYVAKLLEKNKYLCDNIENMDIWGHDWDNVSAKTISPRTIFSFHYC